MNADPSKLFMPLLFLPMVLPMMIKLNMMALLITDAEDPVRMAKIHSRGRLIINPAHAAFFLPAIVQIKRSINMKIKPRCNPDMAMM